MDHQSENPKDTPDTGSAGWMPPERPPERPPESSYSPSPGSQYPPTASGPMPRHPHDRPIGRGYALPAWIVIILMVAFTILMLQLQPEPESTEGDPLGVMLMQIQSRLFVGMANSSINTTEKKDILAQAEPTLNLGSVDQRLRFAVFAAELAGPAEAKRVLDDLDLEIADELAKPVPEGEAGFSVTEEQAAVKAVLHKLYDVDELESAEPAVDLPPADGDTDAEVNGDTANEAEAAPGIQDASADDQDLIPPPALDGLTPDDRDLLVAELGWFGELALHPPGSADKAARDDVLKPALGVFWTGVVAMAGAFILGFIGFVLLVVLLVVACMGGARSGVQPGGAHHGLYAETFAIWLLLHFSMQIGAELLGVLAPQQGLLLSMTAFFASLAALAWPVIRGVPWSVVRRDIGWTLGRAPVLEPGVGVMGYAMAIPLLFMGLCGTLLLMLLQGGGAEGGPFDSTAGPAHPIFLEIANGGLWPRVQILVLAAVAAPIIEETMFRGVLYRHLRDATRSFGIWLSVIISAFINGFIFAAIHPQGWLAIPALMSLAFAFIVVREWRGTIIPSMIVHGISNGLIMSMVMYMVGT